MTGYTIKSRIDNQLCLVKDSVLDQIPDQDVSIYE